MSTARHHRTRYLVRQGLQLRYLSVIVVSMVLASLVTGSLLYFDIWSTVIPEFSQARLAEKLEIAGHLHDYESARGIRQEHPELRLFHEAQLLSGHEQAVVANVLRSANTRVLPKIIILAALIAMASLLMSHRIAGPIYRFIASARAMGRGDLTVKFSLRKDDELSDLADALDQMARALRKQIAQASASAQEMSQALEILTHADNTTPEDRRRFVSLKSRLAKIQQDLSVFTLESERKTLSSIS